MDRVKRFVRELARSYRFHHETNSSLLAWMGALGVVAFSALYLVRLTGKLPPRWDDVWFRLPAILTCGSLALRRWWPESLARFHLPYSYATVFYCLAFFMPLTVLENGGAPNTVINMLLGAMLVVVLTDWRNTVVMISLGYSASAVWFLATRPANEFPLEFLYWWVPLCLVLVLGGSISKYVERRAELERLRRLYSGLAGSIAHEVRNPLAQVQHSMRMAQSLLPRLGSGEMATVPRHQLDAVARELAQGTNAAHRGLQAITLTLQQVNGKAFDSTGFSVLSAATCVQKAVHEYAYESVEQRSRVTVQVAGDFNFRGDETACILILFNLLKNALYYLPLHPDASITISVEAAPVHRIVVRDTGPGIPRQRLPELFEEFHSFGKTEGTGLGLAFCRRAMRAFGGDITCNSELGKFTEFTLNFPELADAAVPAPAPARSGRAPESFPVSFGGRTVLVVDDSAFNRAIVKARLRELDLRVVEARHGQEALQIIDDGARPAAILMDMEMPGISGIEATRALRERPPPANSIPVLALSANDLPAWREGAMAVGMNGYLTKPIQPEILSSELARVLNLDTPSPPARTEPRPVATR